MKNYFITLFVLFSLILTSPCFARGGCSEDYDGNGFYKAIGNIADALNDDNDRASEIGKIKSDGDYYQNLKDIEEYEKEEVVLPFSNKKVRVRDIENYFASLTINICALTLTDFAEHYFDFWLQESGFLKTINFPYAHFPSGTLQAIYNTPFYCKAASDEDSSLILDPIPTYSASPELGNALLRLLMQKIAFKKIPQAILRSVKPEYAAYTDGELAKIVQTVLTGKILGAK